MAAEITATRILINDVLTRRGFAFLLTDRDYEECDTDEDYLYEVLRNLADWGNGDALLDNAASDAAAAFQDEDIEETVLWWIDAAEACDIRSHVELTDEEDELFWTDYMFNGHSDDARALVIDKAREQGIDIGYVV